MKTASVRGRRRALAIAIAVCSGLGAAGAWGEEIEVEEVVVTGSRIKSASVYAPQPISTITSETITQSGQVDITEVLNDNPALLSSVSSSNSIDATAANIGDVGAIGGASLNLRGLGIERTLTVVNGRRHVAGFEGTSAVDVGSIPRALIDRVEVLTGGSSAIYGADAVTGVVNFIQRTISKAFSSTSSLACPERRTTSPTVSRRFLDATSQTGRATLPLLCSTTTTTV